MRTDQMLLEIEGETLGRLLVGKATQEDQILAYNFITSVKAEPVFLGEIASTKYLAGEMLIRAVDGGEIPQEFGSGQIVVITLPEADE